MMRLAMSPAAAALIRALVARAAVPRDRVLLIDAESVDWRSLTFNGERHCLALRVRGPASSQAVARMCDGLADAEFSIPGIVVADIALAEPPARSSDGSIEVSIEALTISED
ncbi:MAG TPA: hypothetical protein VM308_00320 [Sphingomicrobium sp.]|nr:hypothetical protein [Sphingomicrobium sp.]